MTITVSREYFVHEDLATVLRSAALWIVLRDQRRIDTVAVCWSEGEKEWEVLVYYRGGEG